MFVMVMLFNFVFDVVGKVVVVIGGGCGIGVGIVDVFV